MKKLNLSTEQSAELAVYDENVAEVLEMVRGKPDLKDQMTRLVILFGLVLKRLDEAEEELESAEA